MARTRAYRRHQIETHLRRRLSEDRNQHYDDLSCACWGDPRAIARFKEQPATCSKPGCGCRNPRHSWWAKGEEKLTIQERRALHFW